MFQSKYAVILPNYLFPQDRFATYGKELRTAVELIELCASQQVFQGIEILTGEEPFAINQGNKWDVQKALEQNGMSFAGITAKTFSADFRRGSLSAADPKVRQSALDLVRRTIDLAAELGCEFVSQWPGQDGWDYYFEMDYQRSYDLFVEGMQSLADHNPQIKLGLEPKPYEPRAFSLLNSGVKALLMIKDIDRQNVGLTFDIGHALFGHENIGETVAIAQKDHRLFHLHVNDNYGDMDWDLPLGAVHLNAFIEMVYWLMRTDYQGYISMDIYANRTDPAETVVEGQRWFQAIIDLIQAEGMVQLDQLLDIGDGIESQRFLRGLIFGRLKK